MARPNITFTTLLLCAEIMEDTGNGLKCEGGGGGGGGASSYVSVTIKINT